jgi:hypothetical protein
MSILDDKLRLFPEVQNIKITLSNEKTLPISDINPSFTNESKEEKMKYYKQLCLIYNVRDMNKVIK